MLGFETNAMLSHINTPFWVKDYQNLSLGVVLKINAGHYEEIFSSEALLKPLEDSFAQSVPMCSDCAFESYCGAEPVYHYAIHKDFVARKPESDFCNRNMTLFRHLITLMEEDKFVKQLFYRWANR